MILSLPGGRSLAALPAFLPRSGWRGSDLDVAPFRSGCELECCWLRPCHLLHLSPRAAGLSYLICMDFRLSSRPSAAEGARAGTHVARRHDLAAATNISDAGL